MICRYREKIYDCGRWKEVNIYPVYRTASCRRKKMKPSSEVQKKLNKINKTNNFIRLINANFDEGDIRFDPTYAPEHLPQSDEEASKQLRNFLRRVQYYRKKNNLPDLKYVAVTEKGKISGRYHHHIIMNGGIDINVLSRIWGLGFTTAKALVPDETGFTAIAKYMLKNPVASKKSWNSSKNLVHPVAKKRDGRLSQRKVRELARDTENAREYEKYYDGYILSQANVLFNEVNGGTYIQAIFRKKEVKNKRCRQRSPIMRT